MVVSCFFGFMLVFVALPFFLASWIGDSISLSGLISRGRSGLGARRPARFEGFLFHGVEEPDARWRDGVPSMRHTGVVPADAGETYGG